MQLRLTLATMALLMSVAGVAAQSLSPMHKSGNTPSDTKGFRLTVGNPYKKPMTFVIIPMNTAFTTLADHAVAQPSEVRLAPGHSRSVLVAFRIGPDGKERTIGVCVQPKSIEGTVLPRVCGTYTGTVVGNGTGG